MYEYYAVRCCFGSQLGHFGFVTSAILKTYIHIYSCVRLRRCVTALRGSVPLLPRSPFPAPVTFIILELAEGPNLLFYNINSKRVVFNNLVHVRHEHAHM